MSELKPCPFCGGKAEVYCPNCGAKMDGEKNV